MESDHLVARIVSWSVAGLVAIGLLRLGIVVLTCRPWQFMCPSDKAPLIGTLIGLGIPSVLLVYGLSRAVCALIAWLVDAITRLGAPGQNRQ